MGITSFYFLCFYATILILYYLIPKKFQWILLLVASVFYYLFAGTKWLILYPIVAATSTYLGIRLLEKCSKPIKRKLILWGVILLNLGILVTLKYINFGINTVNGLGGLFGGNDEIFQLSTFLIPLGLSFYTLSLIGYIIDVYNGIATVQKNFFKLALYGMYFPTMISGPILQYRECGEQFFKEHSFDYQQVVFGLQRVLWGFFKKLVIAERMALIVNTVYASPDSYPGIYIWIATVCFAFQLYTDFSGCMDIVLGISQTFGIVLPENFKTPFFSKNISEYWRRWHITLGVWMKEYIFYPLLRTNAFTNLAKKNKERFGKKRGKQITTFTAMFLLWFSVGIWHGGDWKYIIGSGLLHWFYIVSGELLEPFFTKCALLFHLNTKGKTADAFRVVRTFFLVCIGFVFFRADSVTAAVHLLKQSVAVWNLPGIMDGTIFTLGLDWIEFTIAAVSLIMLVVVSSCQETFSIRERIASKTLLVRWCFWYALLFYVILLGYYGPGYSAAEFIYQGF